MTTYPSQFQKVKAAIDAENGEFKLSVRIMAVKHGKFEGYDTDASERLRLLGFVALRNSLCYNGRER